MSVRMLDYILKLFFVFLKLIEMKGSQSMIIDASNRFYTLIPHNFGLKKPQILDGAKLIKVKLF